MTLRIPINLRPQSGGEARLGEIDIHRTFTDLAGPGVHRYVWQVETWSEDGRPRKVSSIVDHREADGPLALLRTVLEAVGDWPLHREPGH